MINYGFANQNNEAYNEYAMTVEMAYDDRLAEQKVAFAGTEDVQKTFRLKANFEEPIMSEFLSFLRFVEYDENEDYLVNKKQIWLEISS